MHKDSKMLLTLPNTLLRWSMLDILAVKVQPALLWGWHFSYFQREVFDAGYHFRYHFQGKTSTNNYFIFLRIKVSSHLVKYGQYECPSWSWGCWSVGEVQEIFASLKTRPYCHMESNTFFLSQEINLLQACFVLNTEQDVRIRRAYLIEWSIKLVIWAYFKLAGKWA